MVLCSFANYHWENPWWRILTSSPFVTNTGGSSDASLVKLIWMQILTNSVKEWFKKEVIYKDIVALYISYVQINNFNYEFFLWTISINVDTRDEKVATILLHSILLGFFFLLFNSVMNLCKERIL